MVKISKETKSLIKKMNSSYDKELKKKVKPKTISIKKVLKIMDEAYDSDSAFLQAIHEDENYIFGDGLIEFIYYETMDLSGIDYQKDKNISIDALSEIASGMRSALTQLTNVCNSLNREYIRLRGTKK